MAAGTFDPTWLSRRLEELIPGYPRVSLCVAFSGGVDSVALLAALASRRRALGALRAIHVNHRLHPDSGEWARRCREIARQLHVPLKVLTANVDRSSGVSLEAAARDARYGLLREALAEGEYLLTAHHEDDQFETVLLQLLRGAGLPGLAAMPAVTTFGRGWLVRPLLTLTRASIEAWVRAQGLTWVDDATNVDERFDRNYLRLKVLPLLRERWPGASRAVSRTARLAAEAQRLLDQLARADVERASSGAGLSVRVLRALSSERRKNALRFWITQAGHPTPDSRRLDELAGPLLTARSDAKPCVEWSGLRVERHADVLSIHPVGTDIRFEPVQWEPRSQPTLELPGGLGTLELERTSRGLIDLDVLPEHLTVRPRGGGEKLRPRCGGPTRTLKKLLQEERLAPRERERLPLLFAGDRLLIVADRWVDASIQARPASTNRARLLWRRPP